MVVVKRKEGGFALCRDMKIEGNGMLLTGLVSRGSPVSFTGVGGWGAGLPDSSSDGSPATWAPVWGWGLVDVFFRMGR
jgi:hypothetical protein